MSEQGVIRMLVREQLTESVPQGVPRNEVVEPLPDPARYNRVHIIIGMRRSGKTFYVYQIMNHLMSRGVPRDRLFYFDFSDVRLPADPQLMDSVVDEYWRQVPEARIHGAYLFLDEVQDCENWQGTARRIAEKEQVTLVLTGSSSKLSSSQIATQFRGRPHVHEMLPCSFGEYLRFHEDVLPQGYAEAIERHAYSPQEQTALAALFDRYIVEGGFPDIQNDSPATRIEVLQGYVRDVVARDVAERLARPSVPLATQMALLILRGSSNEVSVNGLVDSLKAAGMRVGWERAEEMAALFRQAYLYFEVREFARGIAAGSTNPPKGYAIDPGLVYAVSRAAQEDIGNRLETAVYLELRRRMAGRRTDAIASYTEPKGKRRKVDFLVGEAFAGEGAPAQPYALYQVSASMRAEKTRKREIEALEAAMEATGLRKGTVITLDEEELLVTAAGQISIVPAWKWFLAR